ncbi:MAG: cytochrome c family protein [Neomegalonema sp.]|nr:cytochrome c family protein [Neomegalonema sp.]
MDGFELNKFFGAIFGALMLFFGLTFLVEGMYSDGHHGGDHHEALAFAMEIEGGEEEAVAEEAPSLPELLAQADADKGKKVFNKCKGCHKVEKGEGNSVGPELYGVMGRDIASHAGFGYSGVLSDKAGNWTFEAMDAFLTDPKGWAPGTAMSFAGLSKPEQRADLLAFLNSKSDAPIALPSADAAEAPAQSETTDHEAPSEHYDGAH